MVVPTVASEQSCVRVLFIIMAAAPAFPGGAATFAEYLGVSVEPKLSFERACDIAKGLKGGEKKLAKPVAVQWQVGQTKVVDLPIAPLDTQATKSVKHLIDMVPNLKPDYDWQEISGLMLQHKIGSLPQPFAPKGPVPYPFHMQILIVEGQNPDAPTELCLLKHHIFAGNVKSEIVTALIQGMGMCIKFGTNTRGGPKGFQYMLDKLGGQQVRCYKFDDGAQGQIKTAEQIDDAYDYILACAPRQEGSELQQSRWIKKQLNDPESPVYIASFTAADIRAALGKIREMELQAECVKDYPFFISDLEEWYVQGVVDKVAHLLQYNCVLSLGRAGVGKSPGLRIVMSADSRWQKRKVQLEDWMSAEWRETSNLDFYRLEKGRVDRPDSLDDCDLDTVPMSKLKAYFDMTLKQAQTKERWGAASWPQGQLRVAADNKYEPKEEPNNESVLWHTTTHPNQGVMPYARFMAMVRPAFSKEATEADMDAILKRCSIVVHCKDFVYVRPAGVEGKSFVTRVPVGSDLIIKPHVPELLQRFTKSKIDVRGHKKAEGHDGVAPLVRTEEEIARLAEEEFAWLDKKMEAAPALEELAQDENGQPTQVASEDPASELARSFSEQMMRLPYGFGHTPPQLEALGMVDVDTTKALFDDYKHECFQLLEYKFAAMRQNLHRSLEASEAQCVAKASVPSGAASSSSAAPAAVVGPVASVSSSSSNAASSSSGAAGAEQPAKRAKIEEGKEDSKKDEDADIYGELERELMGWFD